MRTILTDTDVLINFLRGKEKARHFLESAVQESVLLCSVITVAEIHSGMLAHETERTDALLGGLHIVEVTREIAEKAGDYKRDMKGHRLELMDCLIAATAYCNRAILATGNVKHYPMHDIETILVPV
jgi:predicted nucleic acid-binding protein